MTGVVLLALGALAFPVDARADEIAPAPPETVAAIIEQVEAATDAAVLGSDSAADATLELATTQTPDITPSEPVVEPVVEPSVDSAEPVVATEPAPGPAAADPLAEAASADSDTDTAQYQPPVEAPAETEAQSSPDPADEGGAAPSEWTWIWNWNCKDSVEDPTPTGTTWTWIWNWNCNGDEPLPEVILVTDAGQYHDDENRYHGENTTPIFLGNANTSIRIFSPGDDGPVTQTNSVLVAATTVTTTTILQTVEQIVQQTAAALPALPALPRLPVIPPVVVIPRVFEWPPALGELLPPLPSHPWLGDVIPWGPSAAATAAVPATQARRISPLRDLRATGSSDRGAGPTAVGPPTGPELEAVRRARTGATDGRPERKRELPPALPFPGATTGGPAPGGGGGGALLLFGFIGALVAAFLALPPGGSHRLRLARWRLPRDVDLDQEDRPG